MPTVYRLRASAGHGWLREVFDGPVVTADVREAQQYPTLQAAGDAVDELGPGWLVVAGEATDGYRRGL